MRLIDADVFLKNCLCHLEIMIGRGNGKTIISAARNIAKEIMKETVEKMPTVEAKPVVHAHFIEHMEFNYEGGYSGSSYSCSNCLEINYYDDIKDFKYCPYCGAQMGELVSKADKLNGSEKPNSQSGAEDE